MANELQSAGASSSTMAQAGSFEHDTSSTSSTSDSSRESSPAPSDGSSAGGARDHTALIRSMAEAQDVASAIIGEVANENKSLARENKELKGEVDRLNDIIAYLVDHLHHTEEDVVELKAQLEDEHSS